jgi:hypothetical protein
LAADASYCNNCSRCTPNHKAITISGFTRNQRDKELNRLRHKYESRGWRFTEYKDQFLGGKAYFYLTADAMTWHVCRWSLIWFGVGVLLLLPIIYHDGENIRKPMETASTTPKKIAVTTERTEYPACLFKDHFEELDRMEQSGDEFGRKRMFDSGRCVMLKRGLQISVLSKDPAKQFYPGRAHIRVYLKDNKDVDLWAYATDIDKETK